MKDDEFYEETWQVWYFIKSHAYHFTENFDKKMVEFHVDMFVEYKDFPCSHFGVNLIIRLPPGSKTSICFGQDEVIFISSQRNTYYWVIYGKRPMILKGDLLGQMVSGFQIREFVFLWAFQNIIWTKSIDIDKTELTQILIPSLFFLVCQKI